MQTAKKKLQALPRKRNKARKGEINLTFFCGGEENYVDWSIILKCHSKAKMEIYGGKSLPTLCLLLLLFIKCPLSRS